MGKVKAAASKAKTVTGKKTAAKSATGHKPAKSVTGHKPAAKGSALRAKAAKRSSGTPQKVKSQKVKLKAHRSKQPAAKPAVSKAKPKAVALKRTPVKAQTNKVVNKNEQRLAKFKAVAKKALERSRPRTKPI